MDYLDDYIESYLAGEPPAVDTFMALAADGIHIPDHDHMQQEMNAWQN